MESKIRDRPITIPHVIHVLLSMDKSASPTACKEINILEEVYSKRRHSSLFTILVSCTFS